MTACIGEPAELGKIPVISKEFPNSIEFLEKIFICNGNIFQPQKKAKIFLSNLIKFFENVKYMFYIFLFCRCILYRNLDNFCTFHTNHHWTFTRYYD